MGIGKLFSAGDVVICPLLGFSVVAIALIIERVCLSVYRDRLLPFCWYLLGDRRL